MGLIEHLGLPQRPLVKSAAPSWTDPSGDWWPTDAEGSNYSLERVPGGIKFGLKGSSWRQKELQYNRTVQVGDCPFALSVGLEVALAGDVTLAGPAAIAEVGAAIKGFVQFGPGIAEDDIKIGGVAEAAVDTPIRLTARYVAGSGLQFDGLVCKVGASISLALVASAGGGKLPTGASEQQFRLAKKLASADLLTVSLGARRGGAFTGVTIEPGPDLNRLIDEVSGWYAEVREAARSGAARKVAAAGGSVLVKAQQDLVAAEKQKELAKQIQAVEAQMKEAWRLANWHGNPLNNDPRATPGSSARKTWETGMMKFYNPGVAAMQRVPSLQGELRIAEARRAQRLLAEAAQVFAQGQSQL